MDIQVIKMVSFQIIQNILTRKSTLMKKIASKIYFYAKAFLRESFI